MREEANGLAVVRSFRVAGRRARGRIGDAARLAGYADAMLAAHDRVRQPNESRARQSLHAILSDKLAPDVLTRLLAEGADLSEDEACRIALADRPGVACGDIFVRRSMAGLRIVSGVIQ